jgi:hypothetical protein
MRISNTRSIWRRRIVPGVILVLSLLGIGVVSAAPPTQDEAGASPTPEPTPAECQSCHIDVAGHWDTSAHAQAFTNPKFQEQWSAQGQPSDCLSCHTTGFDPATSQFVEEGVECQACHGVVGVEHPPKPVPILATAQFCGECHTPTLGEWRRTTHATEGVDCMACHDPHSQQPLFADPDAMCVNCHLESVGDYQADLHYGKGIGCVDCHRVLLPTETLPDDGLVATGHAFAISAVTCIACHSDTVHAGSALPGYEHGAAQANIDEGEISATGFTPPPAENAAPGNETVMSVEEPASLTSASLASRQSVSLFQGGIVGLVLGATTAWFVASNARARREESAKDEPAQ